MPTRLKYAFAIRLTDELILTKGSAGKISKYESEAKKIKSKVLISALKKDERKKITSPSHGKWYSLCDESKVVYVVCVPNKYSEKLANQFLDVSNLKLTSLLGIQSPVHQGHPEEV